MNRNNNNNIEQAQIPPPIPPSQPSSQPQAPIYYQQALGYYPSPYSQTYQTPAMTQHNYSFAPAPLPAHFYAPNCAPLPPPPPLQSDQSTNVYPLHHASAYDLKASTQAPPQ